MLGGEGNCCRIPFGEKKGEPLKKRRIRESYHPYQFGESLPEEKRKKQETSEEGVLTSWGRPLLREKKERVGSFCFSLKKKGEKTGRPPA